MGKIRPATKATADTGGDRQHGRVSRIDVTHQRHGFPWTNSGQKPVRASGSPLGYSPIPWRDERPEERPTPSADWRCACSLAQSREVSAPPGRSEGPAENIKQPRGMVGRAFTSNPLALDNPVALVLTFGPLVGSVVVETDDFRVMPSGDGQIRPTGSSRHGSSQACSSGCSSPSRLPAQLCLGMNGCGPRSDAQSASRVSLCAGGRSEPSERTSPATCKQQRITGLLPAGRTGTYAIPHTRARSSCSRAQASGSETHSASSPASCFRRPASSGEYRTKRKCCGKNSASPTSSTRCKPAVLCPASGDDCRIRPGEPPLHLAECAALARVAEKAHDE